MNRTVFLFCILFGFAAARASAQLPPAAQALYDSAWAQDSLIVQYAINNGAQIIATPDSNSFYVQWFPVGSTPNATPLVVSLHGSDGYAFHEFFSWHARAQLHGCGVIALQWYRPDHSFPYDYFPDDTLYRYIDSALTGISYPSGKALLHGFSRGSARSYAVVFNDIQSGKNYFCTTISNAGGAELTYPLYTQIDTGLYGPNVFAGKRWNLFCGGQDTNPTQSGCIGMTNTQAWLQGQGATVDIFIQDSALGHNGFQLQSSFAYKDSILDNYLSCYAGTLSAGEELHKTAISVFPNPFADETRIRSELFLKNATLSVYNALGQEIKRIKNISGQEIKLRRNNLPAGIYWIRLAEDNQAGSVVRLIISD
ncbi:MAG: hypothetical protein FD123_3226 [Bacteroidetes bacterium]|nr:MAG: hypothetical protein FD123_3226 [Bacteroidota bacterium]